jgi:hypothetical protein
MEAEMTITKSHGRAAATAPRRRGQYVLPGTPGAPISMDEIIARYPGEWVLIVVTREEDGWPSEGRVLAHGKSYHRMCQARSAAYARLDDLDGPLYLFEAYPPIRTVKDCQQALARLAKVPDFDPFYWPRV